MRAGAWTGCVKPFLLMWKEGGRFPQSPPLGERNKNVSELSVPSTSGEGEAGVSQA